MPKTEELVMSDEPQAKIEEEEIPLHQIPLLPQGFVLDQHPQHDLINMSLTAKEL
jgi:hypothetical protein